MALPQIGNYRLGAIDQFGNQPPTWGMLRRINHQIHALAPTLLKLRSTGVYHYPDPPDQGRHVRRISPYSGREEAFGREMDWLAPGTGVLLRLE